MAEESPSEGRVFMQWGLSAAAGSGPGGDWLPDFVESAPGRFGQEVFYAVG